MISDAELSRDDSAARSAALDVTRSFIVQAPAGSGKTELLIQRYLKLLATVDDPEEILAITFTRKAAAEMLLRVLQALQQAQSDECGIENHEQVTLAAARDVLVRDRDRNWQLIANPRRMRIQTLDSLNASIARTQAMTASSGAAGNSILADAEMQMLYRRAAVLTLDQLAESGSLPAATRDVLLHVDNNVSIYVGYLARMLETRDQWLPFIGSGLVAVREGVRLRCLFEGNLESAVTEHLRRTRAAFPEANFASLLELCRYAAKRLSDAGQPGHCICVLEGLFAMPAAQPDEVFKWRAIATILLTDNGGWRKTVNKNQGFPPRDSGQKQRMLELLAALGTDVTLQSLLGGVRTLPPVTYSDEQWQVLLSLFQLLPLAVTELKRLFSERGVTDHIDVALCAADALGTADEPGDIALLLDYRLTHLLVDEMQDTSSAQYRMLEALTGGWEQGDGRTLFCVGDPMQSIYRFRNAEVGQFLLARKTGIGNVRLEPLVLRRNFRSGEHLVHWFNDVFQSVLPARDDVSQSAVSYSAAVPVPALAGQGLCSMHPLFGSSTSNEAEAALAIIRRTLDENPDDDMAILVRSRTHLPKLLALLRKHGIAYGAVEIDRLTDLPEVVDILALTRALVHPGDRLAWLAILRSPWAGLDWCDLHALVKNDAGSAIWTLLHDDARLARLSDTGRGLAVALRARISPFVPATPSRTLRDRVEQAWLTLGGPALLEDSHMVDNIYRYLDVVGKLEIAGTLVDVAELEAALDSERVSSQVAARLQVMTMHRAKGLQFDHVLLYGLGRAPARADRRVLSWFDIPDAHGGVKKIISPIGPRTELDKDPVHRYIELTEADKDRHEQGRLLYVACTRARRSLHLLGHVEVSEDGAAFRPPRAGSLLRLLWRNVADDFERAFTADLRAAQNDAGGWLQPVLRRLSPPWSLPEVAPLPGTPTAPDAGADGAPVEYDWVGAAARLAGTVVHRWLQLAADGDVTLRTEELARLRPASERWLRELGVGQASLAPILERVDNALKGVLGDDRGRWLISGPGCAELALSGLFQGRVAQVILDRVRIDADGTHWIVDYKTSSHEGGNLAAFLAAESERYRAQLAKYATLYRNYSGTDARCALYFPLLQEFVEVEV